MASPTRFPRHGSAGIAVAAILLCACVAAAQPAAAPGAKAPPPAPRIASPGDVIATRQLLFHLSAATFGEMKAVADGSEDVKPLAFGARGLVRWSRSIPAMFPPGSLGPNSRAKPEIWSNRADFEAKAAAYQAAATALFDVARAGDKPGFLAQWEATSKTCTACHDLYRSDPPRPATRG